MDSLRVARERAGMTQTEAAKQLGLHQQVLSGIERGERRPPRADLLGKMAELYGASTDALLGRGTAPTAEQEGA